MGGLVSVALGVCWSGRDGWASDELLVRVDSESARGSCPRGGDVTLAGYDVSGEGELGDDEIIARLARCRCADEPTRRAGGMWAAATATCGTSIWVRTDSDGDALRTATGIARSLLVALSAPAVVPRALSGVSSPAPTSSPDTLRELATVCNLRWVDRATTDSADCLGCHDGTLTELAGYSTPLQRTESHPIGVVYATAQASGRARLRPVAELAPAIVLVDGKIECTSCHSGTSSWPASSAMTMRRSALCLACHDY